MSWRKIPASWGLKPGRKPQKHPGMSGVVVVKTHEYLGFSYIRFEQPLVDAIAKRMQYGVSPLHPCHLRLFKGSEVGKWRLFCHYIGSPVGVLLHEYEDRPVWLGKVNIHREKQDVESSQGVENQ